MFLYNRLSEFLSDHWLLHLLMHEGAFEFFMDYFLLLLMQDRLVQFM